MKLTLLLLYPCNNEGLACKQSPDTQQVLPVWTLRHALHCRTAHWRL